MRRSKKARLRQRWGQIAGLGLGLICLAMFFLPGMKKLSVRGPMNIGHEDLACADCHVDAPGTARQQIQANVRYWLGARSKPAVFGYERVNNETCISCHERSNDRHPVFRFNEPRFKEARANIKPQECGSCHQEHQGIRVSTSQDFCLNCHGELSMKNDPISVPHETLVKQGAWDTCLGCHDFHGNHQMETPLNLEAAYGTDVIDAYFKGTAPSPYSDAKYFQAKQAKRQGEGNE